MDSPKEKHQNYQKAIRNVVQHLKCKRSELQKDINCDEKEKAQLMCEVNRLKDRITVLNANLKKKSEFKNEYDKAITQSEEHFEELLKKSEDFLTLTRREALALSHGLCDVPSLCHDHESKKSPTLGKGEAVPRPRSRSASPPSKQQQSQSQTRSLPSCTPTAVITVTPTGQESGCFGCSSTTTAPCATLVIPYKANGL